MQERVFCDVYFNASVRINVALVWDILEVQHLYDKTPQVSLTNSSFNFSSDLDFLIQTRPFHQCVWKWKLYRMLFIFLNDKE